MNRKTRNPIHGIHTQRQDELIPVFRPLLPTAERLLPYLRRIDETRWYTNYGPLSSELQERLATMLRLRRGGVVCASSGTAALVGAILAATGRASPDRPLAIIPGFTFAATAAAVEQCGYRPYLADIDAETWMLDAEQLMGHPELPRVGVVVVVAPFGRPVPQEPWCRFRSVTGVPVVIDGAASFAGLAEYPAALLGPVPVAISFHATKAYATGEGGAVATDDLAFAERSAQILNFGIGTSRDCRMPSLNGKMSEYHAAVGLAELDGWRHKLLRFMRVAEEYRRCAAAAGLDNRFHTYPEIGPNYVLFRCRDAAEAERAGHSLKACKVDFRRWYGRGLHRETYYSGLAGDRLSSTEKLAECLLGLPVAPDLGVAEIARCIGSLSGSCSPD